MVHQVQATHQARDRTVPVSPLGQQCRALSEANNNLRDVTSLSVEITNTFGKSGLTKAFTLQCHHKPKNIILFIALKLS
jgi:hypothetical protein